MGTGVLAASLIDACERYAGDVAAVGSGRSLTYSELLAEGRRAAAALAAAGCGADEPVHVLVSNEPRDLAAILGVWLAGAVVVPVHRDSPPDVRAGLLRRTGARFELGAGVGVAVVAEQSPPAREVLAGAAFIVFTSGSTGAPKGVVIGHEEFDGKLHAIDSLLSYRAGETSLLVLNITFSFGMWCSLLTLRSGGRLVMHRSFRADTFLAALRDEAVVRVGMVPTMMRALFGDSSLTPQIATVDRLKQIMIGGEPLGVSLRRAVNDSFGSAELIDIYGLTETATCDFFGFSRDAADYPGSLGRPAPGLEFRIAGPDADGIGELQIRSPFLMRGYLDDPGLTTATYDDGWLRTGDLGKEVGPGVVSLMGRRKELISRGGNKVTPGEIEQAISAHPDVAAAMAVGVPDEMLGERIHVLLVPRVGASLDVQTVAALAASRLDRFKCPDAYYVGDALPLGRTGKADRAMFGSMVRDGVVEPAHVPQRRSAR